MANKTDRWSKWERLPEKMKRHFHVCRCGRGWFDLTKTRPPRGVKSVKFIGRRRRNGRPAIDLICRADLIVAHHKPNLIFDIFPGKKKTKQFSIKRYIPRPVRLPIHFAWFASDTTSMRQFHLRNSIQIARSCVLILRSKNPNGA